MFTFTAHTEQHSTADMYDGTCAVSQLHKLIAHKSCGGYDTSFDTLHKRLQLLEPHSINTFSMR
jgi:hypothetical protein